MSPRFEHCPVPMPDGSDCWREPEPDGYAGICTVHMLEVARAWVGDRKIGRARCDRCHMATILPDRLTRATICTNCLNVVVFPDTNIEMRALGADEAAPIPRSARPRTDVVYYLAFGDRIKIGTTANLPVRLKVLPFDELLAIEPGNESRERQRHATFRRSLIPGQQEWFQRTDDLVSHVRSVRAKFGPPMGAWRAWSTRAVPA